MTRQKLTRRQMLTAAAAASAATLLRGPRALAQMPPPQPLNDPAIACVTTTEAASWQPVKPLRPTFSFTQLNLALGAPAEPDNRIQGFGACFNELGWQALSLLPEADRQAVLAEFFAPATGGRFTYCRMPVAANDFSIDAYSYDETDGDFELKNFSVDHDRQTLIPFLQAARRYQPALRLWASPWTPPSWMKRNHFYAEAPSFMPGAKPNGIRPDQVGREGQDFFIQEPRYFQAYARYFGKFIDAYAAEGIKIGVVMPQNEFNSAQNFPSCTWTPEGLAKFIQALGPEMERRGVQIYFGTLERANPKLLEKVMATPEAAKYVKGLGTQWAGKGALPALHREFPGLAVFQSEQECGDGKNDWGYTGYCWQLMKHYLRSGASGYMYWNLALVEGGRSTWGWTQNSLVVVDAAQKTYKFTSDYYLLKHLTHFVDVGAQRLETSGTCDDALAFRNPSGSVAVLLRNELAHPQLVQIDAQGRSVALTLAPDSISTLTLPA